MDPALGLSLSQQVARDLAAVKARRLLRAAWYDQKQRATVPPSITTNGASPRVGPRSPPLLPLHHATRPLPIATAPTAKANRAVSAPLPPPQPATGHGGHAQQQHVMPRGPTATKDGKMALSPQKIAQTTAALTPSDPRSKNTSNRLGPAGSQQTHPPVTPPFEGRAGGPVNPLPSSVLRRYPLRSALVTGVMPVLSNTASGAELLRPQLAGRAMERAPGAHNTDEVPVMAVPTAQKQKDQRKSDLDYNDEDDINAANGNGASRGLQLPGRDAQGRTTSIKTGLGNSNKEKPGYLPNATHDYDEGW